MLRRLNIACGVLHHPPLVLLDEPTVGVDPQGRGRIWTMLEGLCREGVSLVQSSHQLDEIQSRCDRMFVVDHGRVLAHGTLDELARHADLSSRSVRITLAGEPPEIALPSGLAVDGRSICGTLHEAVRVVPGLVERLHRAGSTIEDLHVEPPRLDQVFERLTGRELRE
jgi:ABC-2 type transport system ATP-binding protein